MFQGRRTIIFSHLVIKLDPRENLDRPKSNPHTLWEKIAKKDPFRDACTTYGERDICASQQTPPKSQMVGRPQEMIFVKII